MKLPLPVTYAPMEARAVTSLPEDDGSWQYEPKWDGFRCLAFKDGDRVELRSKSGLSLTRYFPEVAGALSRVTAAACVVDGEIIVPENGEPSFDALLQRIHPAATRVDRLARETPACFVVFDLLVDDRGANLTGLRLRDRRSKLEKFFANHLRSAKGFELSPCTRDRDVARAWLTGHTGTDGVMAKKLDEPYGSAQRAAMQKVKRMRTADCVVGGFRYASKGKLIGSLLLGMYDDDGLLHHCGFTSSFTAAERREVTEKVEKLAGGGGFTGRTPRGAKPLVQRAIRRVGAGDANPRLRGSVRSLE